MGWLRMYAVLMVAIVIVAILVGIFGVWIGRKSYNRVQDEVAKFAEEQGWKYVRGTKGTLFTLSGETSQGDPWQIESRRYTGKGDPLSEGLFTRWWVEKGGPSDGVFWAGSVGQGVGAPKNWEEGVRRALRGLADVAQFSEVDIEDSEFSTRFAVVSSQPGVSERYLTADVRAALLSIDPDHAPMVVGIDGGLHVLLKGTVANTEVLQTIHQVGQLLRVPKN